AILLTADDWKLKLITHGKPSFPNELNSKFLFSEAGLDQAISFNKGCYVGQEVIEKIDAFAKSPFTLKHGYLEGEIEMIDEYIVADGEQNKVGTLISSAYDKEVNKTFCFFRLKNKSEVLSSNQLKLNGQTIRLFA
ncbi:MAG: hypothetical protein R3A13_05820, partial [Bdellovibrionota bacterium]